MGHRTTVEVPYLIRKGICEACGKSKKKREIKSTHLHHWRYAYKWSSVKKNPELALENTIELCYACHEIADAIRRLSEFRKERVALILNSAPDRVRNRLIANTASLGLRNFRVKRKGKTGYNHKHRINGNGNHDHNL